MRNLADKWTAVPDWNTDIIATPRFSIRAVSGLDQQFVSGNLANWSKASGIELRPVGAFGVAVGDAYTVALARDRLLVVSTAPSTIAQGWHDDGFAVTTTGAGLQVFEIDGAWNEISARATPLDPKGKSASAAMSFVGIDAVVYRHGETLRVHVDRGLAAYFWTWAKTVSDTIARAA